jgi:hypothetical protein
MALACLKLRYGKRLNSLKVAVFTFILVICFIIYSYAMLYFGVFSFINTKHFFKLFLIIKAAHTLRYLIMRMANAGPIPLIRVSFAESALFTSITSPGAAFSSMVINIRDIDIGLQPLIVGIGNGIYLFYIGLGIKPPPLDS